MTAHRTSSNQWKETGRAVLAAALCGFLIDQPVLGEISSPAVSTHAAPRSHEQVLHALNRFTFGPRPGETAAVEKIGLNRWFEQQLNPASIDDSELDARLAEYPAMHLTIANLEAKFPGPQVIRQMIAGKIPLPSDPAERTMAEDQIVFYKMQKAKQEANAPVETGMVPESEKTVAVSEIAPEGMTPELPDARYSHETVMSVISLAPAQRYQAIMAMRPTELVGMRQSLKGGEQLQLVAGMTPTEKETLLALGGSLRMVALEEMESRLERDVYSNRQLEAIMTDFWLNHFNVYVRKNQEEAYLIPAYERETIRAHALGNFEDLLIATAESPAMLEYLDNARSIGPDSVAATRAKQNQETRPDTKAVSAGLNENYGRELMELHTLGVNGGGYTQADVTNVAKVFTGWTIDKESHGFIFNERRHEPGPKIILGKTIHENGMNEGLEVLHMLAQNPATAHFISEKLAVRFVSDTPPPALVNRMAASYMASHGDIKTVLRTLWNSPELWSPEVLRAKVKTPEEFVVSAVRASGAEVNNPAALVQAVAKLGMPLYGMQTPNGYSWKQDDWVSTGALVSRMNFALVLSGNRIPGTQTEWSTLLAENSVTGSIAALPASYDTNKLPQDKELRLEELLIGQPVSERTRAVVMGQANDASVTAQAETQFDLRGAGGKGQEVYRQRGTAVAVGRPDDAQAAVIAGLLLGSPEFQRR